MFSQFSQAGTMSWKCHKFLAYSIKPFSTQFSFSEELEKQVTHTWEKQILTANLDYYINIILVLPGTPDAFGCSNIFKLTVTCFPSSLLQKQCFENVTNSCTTLFNTVFFLSWTGKTSNSHMEKKNPCQISTNILTKYYIYLEPLLHQDRYLFSQFFQAGTMFWKCHKFLYNPF